MNIKTAARIFFLLALTSTACKKHIDAPAPPKDKQAIVTTIAGNGTLGFADGPANTAEFDQPADVVVGNNGDLLVSDFGNHRIRYIFSNTVLTFAGSSSIGIVNGVGRDAKFATPFRMTVTNGFLFVTDDADPRIRRLSGTAEVTFYAGSPTAGFRDGDTATAQFQFDAGGLASDAAGNIYFDDTFNGRIRKIAHDGTVTTIAGDGSNDFRNGVGTDAKFRFPLGLACDLQGNLYVADAGNYCIRKIAPDRTVSTFAGGPGARGTADGDAASARFSQMGDLAADSHGKLYLADEHRIRKITPDGTVSTIAGSTAGFREGKGAEAQFNGPSGLDVDAQGNIYVADAQNHRIRKISFE